MNFDLRICESVAYKILVSRGLECAKQKGASTEVVKSENITRTAKQKIANDEFRVKKICEPVAVEFWEVKSNSNE